MSLPTAVETKGQSHRDPGLISKTEFDSAALLSSASLQAIRAAPGFRAVAGALARAVVELNASMDEPTRWITKDLGRTSLYAAAIIIQAILGRVSVQDLITAAHAKTICSRGRVLAFVDYTRAWGALRVPDGEAPWMTRSLELTPAFSAYASERFWREMAVIGPLAPEAALALEHRADPRAFPAALANVGRLTVLRPDLFAEPTGPLSAFLNRSAGMSVVFDWLSEQPNPRDRLLEQANLNRADLSRRYGISRVHLNTLLGEAEAAGHLRLPASDWVVVSPELSEDVERLVAKLIAIHRVSALAVLAACGEVEAPAAA